MEEPARNASEFTIALQNAKDAQKDLTSITTALSALIAVFDKLPSKPAQLAVEFTRHGYTLSVHIVATTTPAPKSPEKT